MTFSDELKVSKALKFGFEINGYRAELPHLMGFADALSAAPIIEPFNARFGVYNQTPFGLQTGQVANPLRVVNETANQDISSVYRVVGNVYAEVNFLKNFNFRAAYYGDLAFNKNRHYDPIVRVYNAVRIQIDTTTTGPGFLKKTIIIPNFNRIICSHIKNNLEIMA